jgi:hypothetical protein
MTAAVLDKSIRKFSNSPLRKTTKKGQTVREYSVHFFGWEAGSICIVINFTNILKAAFLAMKKVRKPKMVAQKSFFGANVLKQINWSNFNNNYNFNKL